MVSNDQARKAFREILMQIETTAVRADAIFELMLERGQINPQELESVLTAARVRQQSKWDQIFAKVDSLLEKEADDPVAKVA